MKKLYCLLFIFFSFVFCNYIFAEGGYDFEKMWPVLKQPWYFNEPNGIATDTSGNVYVADIYNNRVQKFTSAGTFITKWGSNGSGDGQFSFPLGIAIDTSGNVYVAEYGNNRIQKFIPSPGTLLTYYVNGYVKDNSSTAISGVMMSLSGSLINQATTNASGYYEFLNLSTGTYTVTPTKTGYTFSAANITYSNLSSNQTNQNFFGAAVSTGTTPPITNPAISVSLTTLDFGEVVIGQSKSLTFTITDTANTNNLTGTISDDQDWITTDKTAFSGNSTTVNVTVNTAGKSKAQFTGNITITPTSANSGSPQTITVKVSPTCVIPSPNPFRPGAGKKLTFRGNGVSNGTIWIYILSGELVKILKESVGFHELEWDGILDNGSLISSGIYFYNATNPKEPTGNRGYFTVTK